MRAATFVVLLLIVPGASALEWSEILFDPQGTDNGLEFIELVGNESLEGCTVSDSSSSDPLTFVHNGTNGLILIVEQESALMDATTDAAVYHAGAAIGNALGNTGDSVTIACGNDTLLVTTYDPAAITGWQTGQSIVLRDNAWVAGVENGTPGSANPTPPPPPPAPPPGTVSITLIKTPKSSGGGGGGGYVPPVECDSTLLVTVSATEAFAGDLLSFTVLAVETATFEVFADDETIDWGETVSGEPHMVAVPLNASEMRIVATSDRCDAHQRAVRLVKVLPAPVPAVDLAPAKTPEMAVGDADPPRRQMTGAISAPTAMVVEEVAAPLVEEDRAAAAPESVAAPIPAREVIVDDGREVVVWVSAFGIVTLLISAALFLHLRRQEEARTDGGEGRKVYKRRRGPARREGQRHPQADQGRVAPGDRDVRDRGEAQGARRGGLDEVLGEHPR